MLKSASDFIKAVSSHLERCHQKVSWRLGEHFLGHRLPLGITVFTVNGGAERAGRVTQAPTDTGAVCLQRHLWQVRTLHGHSPRPGLRPRRAALPASLPCRSHLWDQRAWDPVGHSRTLPLPHLQVWASHLGAGSQRKTVESQSQEHPWRGTPSTQRLRALHGGAGVHGGWRTSVPALCVVSPDEQSPLNPRGSGECVSREVEAQMCQG